MKEANIDTDIKLNIGCGGRPLTEYINIDFDDLETLKLRYPQQDFPDDIKIYRYDIFNLPFPDDSVSEIRADSLIEHLSFIEEPKFFLEVKRIYAQEEFSSFQRRILRK